MKASEDEEDHLKDDNSQHLNNLLNAARQGRLEEIEALIKLVDINTVADEDSLYGAHTALEIACMKCKIKTIKKLITRIRDYIEIFKRFPNEIEGLFFLS